MGETTNYQLYLEDNPATKFKEWWKKINGTQDSNMIKIDTALNEKADKSVTIFATLQASAWAGLEPPFTQELLIEGLTAEQNGNIAIATNTSIEQRNAARAAMLSVTGQEDGKLIISADGELPGLDIPVVIVEVG